MTTTIDRLGDLLCCVGHPSTFAAFVGIDLSSSSSSRAVDGKERGSVTIGDLKGLKGHHGSGFASSPLPPQHYIQREKMHFGICRKDTRGWRDKFLFPLFRYILLPVPLSFVGREESHQKIDPNGTYSRGPPCLAWVHHDRETKPPPPPQTAAYAIHNRLICIGRE